MCKLSIFIPSVDLSDEGKGKRNDRKKKYMYMYIHVYNIDVYMCMCMSVISHNIQHVIVLNGVD